MAPDQPDPGMTAIRSAISLVGLTDQCQLITIADRRSSEGAVRTIAFGIAGACLLLLTAGEADATVYTERFNVSAWNFHQVWFETGPITPPFDPLRGSFTITFDTNLTTSAIHGGVHIGWNNFPAEFIERSDIGWYLNPDATVLSFGTGEGDYDPGANGWRISIANPVTNPTFAGMMYSEGGGESLFEAADGRVPEPASAALLAVAIIGLAARRSRVRPL
jgi:hypothetical protein